MKTVLRFVLCACCACVSFSTAANVYKWTDSQGNVHYEDHPPIDAKHVNVTGICTPVADPDANAQQVYGGYRRRFYYRYSAPSADEPPLKDVYLLSGFWREAKTDQFLEIMENGGFLKRYHKDNAVVEEQGYWRVIGHNIQFTVVQKGPVGQLHSESSTQTVQVKQLEQQTFVTSYCSSANGEVETDWRRSKDPNLNLQDSSDYYQYRRQY